MTSPALRGEPVKTNLPDPNEELYSREPLRIIFALAALLLGFIVCLHG